MLGLRLVWHTPIPNQQLGDCLLSAIRWVRACESSDITDRKKNSGFPNLQPGLGHKFSHPQSDVRGKFVSTELNFFQRFAENFGDGYNPRTFSRRANEKAKPMSSQTVTQLLLDWRGGNEAAFNQLIPMVYDELRGIARRYLKHEDSGHSLQSADLVNEAYLKLVNQQEVDWQNRAHFFAVSANIMRHLLVDHARSRQRAKRGGQVIRITLNEETNANNSATENRKLDLLALDEALNRLAEFDQRKSRIVELRYFGGLSFEETAEVLGVSEITIKRDWLKARAWLFRALGGAQQDDSSSMAEN